MLRKPVAGWMDGWPRGQHPWSFDGVLLGQREKVLQWLQGFPRRRGVVAGGRIGSERRAEGREGGRERRSLDILLAKSVGGFRRLFGGRFGRTVHEMECASSPAAATAGSQDSIPRSGIQKLSDSLCASQYAASLKCLDDSDYDKSKCQDQFDAYKACRKLEKELRLEANRKSKGFF